MSRRLRIALLGVSAVLAAVLIAVGVIALGCPPVESLKDYRPPQASRVLDRDGRLLARLAPEERIVVPLTAVSPTLVKAFIAVEDQRFYEHHGIDWRRVAGAFWRDLKTLSPREGSSTITMQLARNVFPDSLSRARTLRRKIAEMFVARRIEKQFTKQQILEMYLNQIYLGNGYYGVEAAARGYFGKGASDLTPSQAALLAALPKAPSNYDPRRYAEAALKRRNLVLTQMAKAKVISPKEEAAARKIGLRLKPAEEEGGAPWFVAEVRRELHERFGPDAETQGLTVKTTLDAQLQHAAEKELVRQIVTVEKGKHFPGKPCAGEADECLEGLFVALDPQSGDVRALVGGRDYELSEFDRATQARRQPGSTFKAFVWTAALQAGVPISALIDVSQQSAAGEYAPADGQTPSDKPINLREALRISSNRAAVALGEHVGVQRVIDAAHACGIYDEIPAFPSTFLGASETTPIELVAAFAPFANGGTRVTPRFIDEVRNPAGDVLWTEPLATAQGIEPGVAFLMSSLLQDVVEKGTGAAARAGLPKDLPVLGKTGTTNGAQDVWFIGATPGLVAGAWLGFDKPRPLGPAATGGRLAAPVFARAIAAWQRGKPLPAGFPPPPPGIERHDVDTRTGGLATAGCPSNQVAPEWYAQGTEPQECHEHAGGLTGFIQRTFSNWFH